MIQEEKRSDSTAQPSIWVNAAPFGFGPAAIAYNLFPQLKKLVSTINRTPPLLEYVGSGLSLDFNRHLPWNSIHEVDTWTKDGTQELLKLCRSVKPDLVISILDLPFAETLHTAGASVVVVDALMWYWDSTPRFYHDVTMILAQNFVGVSKAIEAAQLRNAVVLPAMAPVVDLPDISTERKGTLVNLGGLQTPFSALADNVKYTRLMLRAIESAIEQLDNQVHKPLVAITSSKVCHALRDEFPYLETVDPQHAKLFLRNCHTAFLTAGMGNIFDAVDYGSNVAFLPPICKSHGLQLSLLRSAGIKICTIDWHELIEGKEAVDYHADDPSCFAQVKEAEEEFEKSDEAQSRLVQRCASVLEDGEGDTTSMQKIPEILGRGDHEQYVRAIVDGNLRFAFR